MCDVETQIRMLRKKLDVIEYEVNAYIMDKAKELHKSKEYTRNLAYYEEESDGFVRQNSNNKNLQKSGPKESPAKANF